ncbi:primosomal protein N' [Bifidobacterium sp. UBA744]|uniref:primosomal protein N' family DNA-binding protein n=1 Tax=Bifidobacterium sp. UBA744 TaxID=1946112 RepID=UPI0025B7C584|nr:primosomal protein N' [Bifidobacterium sp. UBA744]
MSTQHAQQLTLDGFAPRKRRRASARRTAAASNPIAQVVLDVQATHLGRSFDYLVPSAMDGDARPGVQVRVRFGGQLLNGVIWSRTESSPTPLSSLRYLERVLSPIVVVGEQMRRDIASIADYYGGTRANILRFAIPPRVARVETEQALAAGGEGTVGSVASHAGERLRASADDEWKRIVASYDQASAWRASLEGHGFAEVVVDSLPGTLTWARDAVWMMMDALLVGKSVVMVLPDMRHVSDVDEVLRTAGLRRFAPSEAAHGGWSGDYVVLSAASAISPAERYRAYLAVAGGQVRCVIGTRAAMYAPVSGSALFAIVDDVAYQNADGFMPYPQARGVLRLRARNHGGVFVALGHARSPISQASRATFVHALPTVAKERSPWCRWLNREELVRLGDPTAGVRVPHTAVRVLGKALESGPVLLSIPAEGVSETLSCAKCHRQARCPRCTGPLELPRGAYRPDGGTGGPGGPASDASSGRSAAPRCRWCGAAAVGWRCPHCRGGRMSVVHVGAAGTAVELQGLFRGVPFVVSSPHQPRGVVESIADRPQLVIATPGCEPRVRPTGRSEAGSDDAAALQTGYQAVAILDAWTSLYALGVDARTDTLTAWMRAVALCKPRTLGGQALLLGQTDPVLARSLVEWNSPCLAAQELLERQQTGLPPVVAAACVWGRRDAVAWALRQVGVLDGEWAEVAVPDANGGSEVQPSVLGPVPIAQPATMNARELEETRDRVKAVVRVPLPRREELASRLRSAVAKHVATRTPGELRFQLDPKDLI